MFGAAIDAVDVAIGQIVFAEEIAVLILDHEVEAPEIGVELIGGAFRRRIYDAEMDPERVGAGNASELVGAIGEGFIHAGHAAIDLGPGAGAGVEIEAVPLELVRLVPEIFSGERFGGIELEAPFVFAGDVGASLAAVVESDVVVDVAVVDERTEKGAAIGIGIPLAVADVGAVGDEVICGKSGKEIGRESLLGGAARATCTDEGRKAVVDEISEVRE